jgi:hypothetical protein
MAGQNLNRISRSGTKQFCFVKVKSWVLVCVVFTTCYSLVLVNCLESDSENWETFPRTKSSWGSFHTEVNWLLLFYHTLFLRIMLWIQCRRKGGKGITVNREFLIRCRKLRNQKTNWNIRKHWTFQLLWVTVLRKNEGKKTIGI